MRVVHQVLADRPEHQAGAAAHAAKLTADLRLSRHRLVTAREEERRRIRRDLHDGLGPQLASQTLTLTAARRMLADDPKLPTLIDEIQTLYLEDDKPWVIGFSGGKDSTTILSLIYVAVTKLKKAQRHKH